MILAGIYVALPLGHLNDYAWDYDEGPQMQAAALANLGYPLYSEIVLNKPPLLTWILQLAFHVGGTTVLTARLAVLSITTLGYLALGLLAEQWWGPWSGVVAMGLLLALPATRVRAAVVMGDLPAMAAAMVSLAAARRFARVQRWHWLVISGVAFSVSAGFHLILAPLAVPVLCALLGGTKDTPQRCAPPIVLLAFGGVATGVLLTFAFAVDWRGLSHWVIEFNSAPVILDRPISMLRSSSIIGSYLGSHWPLIAMAVTGGAVQARGPHRSEITVAIVWLAVTLAALLGGRLLRDHYLVFLSYPLAVLAAGGTRTIRHVLESRRQVSASEWLPATILAILTLCLGLVCATLEPAWSAWTSDQHVTRTAVMQADSAPFVVTDDQFLVFAAGRLVPPTLADTSFKRIETGFLRTDEIIGAMLQYGARLVVLHTDRLARLPGLVAWLKQTGAASHPTGSADLYQVDLPTVPDFPVHARLGNGVNLLGFSLAEEQVDLAGNVLTITLFWQCLRPIEEDLTVFVHLTDGAGHLIWQHDGMPLLQAFPTSAWLPGVIVPDPHPVHLTGVIPAATYDLSVGLYRWPSLERLPAYRVDGSRWPEDRVHLTTLDLPAE